MDSTELLKALKAIESEINRVREDHLDVTLDRNYESSNYLRVQVVDMLHRNKVVSSIYVSNVVFSGSSLPPISESCEEMFDHAPW